MGVVRLPANQPRDRFYRGGAQIDDFRSVAPGTSSAHQPEDWVASTTSVFGQDPIGLTRWPDGRALRDLVEEEPTRWLAPEHIARFGTDVKLLI